MSFDFPSNPSIDQEYVDDASGANYKYDGVTWLRMPSKAAAFEDAPADGTTYGRNNKNWINLVTQMALIPGAIAQVGDVKQGFQVGDHMGWIKLDGRAITTLSLQQQTAAKALGFAVNLPNGANAVLVQNGLAMGAVTGTMSRTLTRANLPAFDMTAGSAGGHLHTVESGGGHTHESYGTDGSDRSFDDLSTSSDSWGIKFKNDTVIFATADSDAQTRYIIQSVGGHVHTMDNTGAHEHTVSSGGTGVAIDITPRSISCNMFLYLGT